MNQSTRVLVLGISAFLAFSIGLNLGLMGFFHQPLPPSLGIVPQPEKQLPPPAPSSAALPSLSSSSSSLSSLSIPPAQPLLTPSPTPAPTSPPTTPPKQLPLGPFQQFLQQNGQLPIAVLTCNRVELLDQSIRSLLQVHGVSRDVIVFQDGSHEGIAQVAKKHDLQLVQNLPKSNLRGMADGAARIASHYRFALTKAFEMRPNAPGIIIVEDDLLFSPDFYQYFVSTSPVLDEDPSVLLISAWNDNGFKGLVADPFELRRTDYFPGLGWLLPRQAHHDIYFSLISGLESFSKRSCRPNGRILIGIIG